MLCVPSLLHLYKLILIDRKRYKLKVGFQITDFANRSRVGLSGKSNCRSADTHEYYVLGPAVQYDSALSKKLP